MTSIAEGAQLSLRFAGGGNEVTLAYGETAEVQVVWTMGSGDTTKSGAKVTGASLRFNADDDTGEPASGLQVLDLNPVAGWDVTGDDDGPFTEGDFFFSVHDPSGSGVAGNGTVFETVIASIVLRNEVMDGVPEVNVTMRHSVPGDPLPDAENGAALWTFKWQEEVSAAKQFDLGAGSPGDADAVWDPNHGYETFQPLVLHLTGGSQVGGDCPAPPAIATLQGTYDGVQAYLDSEL